MDSNYNGKERRSFVRYEFKKPMHYSLVTSPKEQNMMSDMIGAISKNISGSGILFTTDEKHVPDLSSLLILDLDYKTARACAHMEDDAIIVNNKLLGEVVRVEEGRDHKIDVGVAFVRKSQELSEDIKKVVKRANDAGKK